MQIGEDLCTDTGVVFCASNATKVFNCKVEYVEQALNDAGYYEEDEDFNQDDLIVIAEIVDDFGRGMMECMMTAEKKIWFSVNEK